MLGIGVIGTGGWGKNHARVYKELWSEGAISNLVLCDADQHQAGQLGKTLEVEFVADYRRLLENDAIQAVSIVSPSKTHYQIAKEFIEAGKDVLVEKPMTMNIEEAERLVQIATSNSRILMAGHLFRYHPAVRELKHRILAGELGRIQNMISNRFAFGLPRRDMGVIYALGTHELDMFCHLLEVDYPKSLTAVVSKSYDQGQDIEETTMIAMDFGYAKGYALESWLVPAYGKLRELVVGGSERSARVDYLKPQELEIFDSKIVTEGGLPVRAIEKEKRTLSLPDAEPLKEELKHFVSCVISRQAPLTDGRVGLRAVVMAEAALASARTGRAVALP